MGAERSLPADGDWHARDLPLTVAVNLSALQLRHAGLFNDVSGAGAIRRKAAFLSWS